MIPHGTIFPGGVVISANYYNPLHFALITVILSKTQNHLRVSTIEAQIIALCTMDPRYFDK